MKYTFSNNVRNDEKLRASFNELTRKTFCFDFVRWYERGHWQDKYIPHVLVDDGKVVSNVSVNLMQFKVGEEVKSFIQLGTVMTDVDYRGQGLNRYIMERIIEEYSGKVDGIYLFGNDSVLNYYPKFGFKPIMEYEYSCKPGACGSEANTSYEIQKVDLSLPEECDKLYAAINECDVMNPNDGFAMCGNIGLYQFWLAADFDESVYYVPQVQCYVLADVKGDVLHIHQVIGKHELDVCKFAAAFGKTVGATAKKVAIKLHYTPAKKEGYEVSVHKKEDCTLFIIGEALEVVEREKLIFPEISHA